jgi:chaperone modulatory protein CbpM
MITPTITFETILLEFTGLPEAELRHWIAQNWVRPSGPPAHYQFHEIDRARIRLILDLRDTLEITEPAIPTVLSLLDQLYEMRRHMHRLNQALETLPPELRTKLLNHLQA